MLLVFPGCNRVGICSWEGRRVVYRYLLTGDQFHLLSTKHSDWVEIRRTFGNSMPTCFCLILSIIYIERERERETETETDTERGTGGRAGGGRADGRTDGRTDRQTDGRTDRQTDRHTERLFCCWCCLLFVLKFVVLFVLGAFSLFLFSFSFWGEGLRRRQTSRACVCLSVCVFVGDFIATCPGQRPPQPITVLTPARSSTDSVGEYKYSTHIYHWRELPQVSFLSQQKFCRDKHVFV